MKECLDCIIAALPDIGQVSIVIVLLSLWYSIFGVMLYRGAFYTCSESDKMDSAPVTQFLWDNATINVADWLDCMGGAAAATNVSWRHEELHFDEVGAGMRYAASSLVRSPKGRGIRRCRNRCAQPVPVCARARRPCWLTH